MKRNSIILMLMLSGIGGYAQTSYKGKTVSNIVTTQDSTFVTISLDLNKSGFRSKDMMIIEPMLCAKEAPRSIAGKKVAIAGKKRYRMIKRAEYFDNTTPDYDRLIKYTRRNPIIFHTAFAFEEWMRDSELLIGEQYIGCCNCPTGSTTHATGVSPRFFKPYQPHFKVFYIQPPVETVKIQSETYSASLQFPSGKSLLNPSFGNNKAVLNNVDSILLKIKEDNLLTIRRIEITGYASPEGNELLNTCLSDERARALKGYLFSKGISARTNVPVLAKGMGEDWEGLSKIVAASTLADKDKIEEAIATMAVDRRKTYLRNLSGGRTYATLLNEFYPVLRRNEYRIEYQVRGFNAQEAAEQFRRNPKYLSLNELFMVSELYERNSSEFKEVFDVATKLYPESPIAQLNTAVIEIENGLYDAAIKRLEKIDLPEAYNNLGVAYWHKGLYDKAWEMLEKANIEQNIEEYNKWKKEMK